MEVKSNYDNSKVQENDGYITKMQNDIKLIFFRVFYQILKDEDQSIMISCCCFLIMFLQFQTFIFQRQLYKIWRNEAVSYQLYKFFGYFMLTPYFEMLNFASLVSMMYVSVGIIAFTYMMIFFLGYTQKISYSWPVILLKTLIMLFTTILYLPILDLLFTVVNCKTNEQDDETKNVVFPNETCWSGSHIIHGIVAIISIAIFVILTLTCNLLYFEAKYNQKDILSKHSGRAKTFKDFFWFILFICYITIDLDKYDYVLVYIILIGNFFCFIELHIHKPCNHVLMQKIVSIFASLMLWSALLFSFSYYLEEKIFHGTIYAWIIGVPLIAFAVYKKDRYNYDLLLMNLNKQDDPQKILQLTQYIQKLLTLYPTNQHYNVMLDALIEVHKTTCSKDDCVFKMKKQLSAKQTKMKDESISQRDYQIHQLLGEIFSSYIRKHQNLISLRINYAFYLLEFTKQKQQALNELCQIEQLSPALDNEFTIFRYKKIIEEEMNQNQNDLGNLDVASELTFQNNMRQFQNKIERATLMHMDFWSQLQEDSPDLGKMNEIGTKINVAIVQVEELWNKMQKMTQNLPKAMRLYGKFIIEVLQDKDFGEELLEKAKVLQTQNNKMRNKQTIQIFSGEDLQFEPLPTLLVSTNSEKFVQITNLNLSICNLFGYHKSELLNRKINLLIPSVYAKSHDGYIEQFLQSNDQQKLQKERLVYLKLKSGYIVPSFLNMKALQAQDENLQIAAQFRTIRTLKATCYLLLDADEVIEQITSNCIQNLLIDHKMISHRKIFFNELFPDYNRQDYLNKNVGTIILNLFTPLISNSNYLPYYVNELEQSIPFQITVTEIDNENHDQVMGYVVKLEKAMSEQSQILSMQLLNPAQSASTFQFKYFAQKTLYVGEALDEQNSARVDQTVIWEQSQSRLSEETSEVKKVTKTEIVPRINYAEGIRTLKLFDNRVQDADDIRMSFSEQDEIQHSSVFSRNEQSQEEIELGQRQNVFRSRKALFGAINDYKQPEQVVYLSWTINFMMLVVLTLSFVAYFLGTYLFQNVQDSLNLLKYASIRNSECNQILMNIQNLEMLRLGIWNFTSEEAAVYEKEQRIELNTSIYSMADQNKKIMLSDLYINDEIEELHSKSVVKVRVTKDNFQYYDLIQGVQQVISKALIVKDKPLSSISKDDEDTGFLLYNLFNEMVFQLRNETNQFSLGIKNIAKNNISIALIVLIIASSFLFVLLLIIVLFLIQINLLQEQILQLFIGIPEKTVKFLYNKSENFISNLQVGEEEELASDVSEEELDESKELSRTLKSKRRRKIFKNTNSFHRTQIIITVFLLCIFGGYYLLNYFLNQVTYSNFNQQLRELNATVRCGSYYRYVDNAERQLFLNREDPILLNDSYTTIQRNIQTNYDIDSELHQEHAQNQDIMNSDYFDTFQTIFMLNPCQVFSDKGYTTVEDCESFASGSIKQGMAVAMARHFENIRYLMTIYDMFYGYPEVNFTAAARGWGVFRNITQDSDNVTNYIYNLNNFKQAKESRVLQNVYIKAAYSYLVDQFISALKSDIEITQTQLLAFFIVFEVLIFLVYFIVWLPASIRMTRDIWRTKSLILMIPLSVILKIKPIKEFISMLLKQ